MDLLVGLGRTLGFSFAAGINLYATVALLGLASRFGWVALPPQYKAFDHDWVIYTAIALYVIEFLADKIPWVDTVWDTVHTVIRPVGGALIAVTTLGEASPAVTALTALLGGVVAGSTHVTKAGTRVVANTSPEPFTNWLLSLGEDAFVVSLGFVALKYPLVALAVVVVLLALIALSAAAIIRAFRRRFRRGTNGSALTTGTAAMVAVIALGLASMTPASAQQPASQTPAQTASQEQRPIFRAGANFVRVDVFATKDGKPVADLTAGDFEVFEDNTIQKVETFERVNIDAGGAAATRVEPRTVRESREMASDPRARVFILFLDTYHVKQTSAINVRRPLTNMLNRLLGPDDLIAVMTPDMAATDITFTRRTDKIVDMLTSAGMWGQREELIKRDPIDAQYEQCYPSSGGRATSAIAEAMIQRRREVVTLDALEQLVRYVGGLREERKAILVVSEGWLLFRPDRALAEISTPQRPGVYVGPDGRLTMNDTHNAQGVDSAKCDQDRVALAQIDDDRRFRDILDEANRANASFYPIEPRGLAVFDTDMGPNPPPSLEVDAAMLTSRHEALRVAALNTDGIAVLDSNDIDKGLKRVTDDLSTYYLLGYSSTNAKADGRFRSIKVRVKRPGVEIRARRGYKAPTAEEVADRVRAAAAPRPTAEATGISNAVTSLDSIRPGAAFRLTVSSGWWMPAGEPVKGQPQGAEPALWILGEIDAKARGGEEWARGGEAEVTVSTEGGTAIVSYLVPVPAGTTRFLTRFPRTAEDVWLDPGAYVVRVRARAEGGIPTTDTARFELPAAPGTGTLLIGQAVYARRAGGANTEELLTADRRFRRTERVVVQATTSLTPDSVSAELLDRNGKTLPLPVTAAATAKDDVRWVRAELPLAPLAPGDYIIRITTVKGSESVQMLAAFRIVP
ncbi:MAG: VWA domain-containing protein [Acidobacteria bacterium]|nr:VWA domain-containing protein [Acidobacteriota bacterium]